MIFFGFDTPNSRDQKALKPIHPQTSTQGPFTQQLQQRKTTIIYIREYSISQKIHSARFSVLRHYKQNYNNM